MKVHQLISILERYNPEANVLLGVQPSWPFEHNVQGVVCRSELNCDDGGIGSETVDDVIICEGSQRGYGSKDMWDACTSR